MVFSIWSYRIDTYLRLEPRFIPLKTAEAILKRGLPVYSHAFPVSDAARLPFFLQWKQWRENDLN